VLSRCLQFNLKRHTVAEIESRLEHICAVEKIPADAEGLKALARAADGSMRDALSLLDQGVAFGGGKVEGAAIRGMLGTIDREHVLRMLEALAKADGNALLAEVDQLDERAPDYGAVLDDLLAALQHIEVLQLVRGRLDDEEVAALGPLAERLTPEDVQLYFQIALAGRRDLPFCRDARVGFEMTLLRMLAFRPAATPAEADAPRPAAGGGGARGGAQSPDKQRNEGSGAQARDPAAASRRESAPNSRAAEPARAGRGDLANGALANGTAGREIDWPELLRSLDLRGPARQLADHCDLQSHSGGAWQLVLPADKQHLNTQQLRARIESALKEHMGQDLRLNIVTGTPARPTPADIRTANDNERMRAARAAIENDPNVRALQEQLGATIEADSVRPIAK
jgi:DNA polymerase-3 subunit gamma/tau